MQTSFDKVMDFVLSIEGGYVDDPSDPGGETKYGISKRAHPEIDIRALSEVKAREIYKKEYWEKIGGDSLPAPLDIACMDTAVNMGVSAALEILQHNRDYRDFLLERIGRYIKITVKNTTLAKYFRGWIIRVYRLYKLCRG